MPKLPARLEGQLRTFLERLKDSSLPAEERAKLLAWVKDLLWTAENEAIRLFEPHGGQEEFLALLDADTLLAISGAGNGWGKSELLAAIFAAAMWPAMAPEPLRLPVFQNWSFPKRARIYSTPAELAEIGSLQTAIARIFPAGRYTSSKGLYNYPQVFYADSGWVLDMFSYERPAKEAAGPNIGLQAFNEPPPEPLYKEAVARARAGGIMLGGMTSLTDEPWVVDGLFGKADGKTIKVRFGSSCENCIEHGKNGNLGHKRIIQILDQFDPDEREARFSGRPLSLSGRIFKGFDRSVHVAAEEFQPEGDVQIGMVCDPAIGKPLALAWYFVDRANVVHFYDEWPETPFEGMKDNGYGVADYAALIRSREAGRTVHTRILDRHFGNTRRALGGKTLKAEFSEHGIEFTDSYTAEEEVETGILKGKEYLRWDKTKPQDSLNRPRVRISPKCRNLIAALERWGRDPKTAKPLETYKDFADLFRYVVMSNPTYDEPVSWPATSSPYYGVEANG